MKNCTKHNRFNCYDYQCQKDNAGEIGVNTNGDLTVGLGNGLTMDLTDGSLGMRIAPGVSIDFDGQ